MFKEIDDVIVEDRVGEAPIILIPQSCTGESKAQLRNLDYISLVLLL